MRIAFIVCAYPPDKTGIGNSAFHFASGLTGRGHQVAVFTAKRSVHDGSGDIAFNHEVYRLKPLLRYGYGAVLGGLNKKLSGYDIIHLHYPYYGTAELILLNELLRRGKMKLAVHYHMDSPGLAWPARIIGWPARRLKPLLFRRADAVTCANIDYLKHSELGKLYEKRKERFFEAPFGVDSGRFRFGRKGKLKKEILFVGGLDRAHYFKGVPVLLRAFAEISDPDARLIIVGRGGLEAFYRGLAEKLGISARVNFAGRVDDADLPAFYRSADAFVLPSTDGNEAFGLVLLEAMASGTPVVASALPGVRTVFRHGREGFYAKPGDPGDLAKRLAMVISNRKLRDEMGARGRELALEKYDWAESCARLEKIYQNMLES